MPGAVVNFLYIIRGLGLAAFASIPDAVRDISQQLRLVEQTDPDELTRVHARTALDDLKDVTNQYIQSV